MESECLVICKLSLSLQHESERRNREMVDGRGQVCSYSRADKYILGDVSSRWVVYVTGILAVILLMWLGVWFIAKTNQEKRLIWIQYLYYAL